MTDISENIRRVSQDLNDLLKKLSHVQGPDAACLIEGTLTPEMLRDFKLSVDSMRNLLWIYILAASYATSGDIDDPIHGLRLRLATETLRSLREDGIPLSRKFTEGCSFVEQVGALVTYYSRQEEPASQFQRGDQLLSWAPAQL